VFPRGGLAFIRTRIPDTESEGVRRFVPVERFVVNQDEGGAIKGPGRVDIFWGAGGEAESIAGYMKERGSLYFILQK